MCSHWVGHDGDKSSENRRCKGELVTMKASSPTCPETNVALKIARSRMVQSFPIHELWKVSPCWRHRWLVIRVWALSHFWLIRRKFAFFKNTGSKINENIGKMREFHMRVKISRLKHFCMFPRPWSLGGHTKSMPLQKLPFLIPPPPMSHFVIFSLNPHPPMSVTKKWQTFYWKK